MDTPGNAPAVDVAAVHRALASPVRVSMLRLLSEQRQTVTDLARASRLSISMASRHVTLLAASGLIARERNGRDMVQRLTPAGAAALRLWSGDARDASPPALLEALTRPESDLSGMPPDEVDFVLLHGMAAFAHGHSDRDVWLHMLCQDLGREWRPRLPTIWQAAMRLFRGETLEGLPLPAPVIAAPPAVPVLRPAERAKVPAREER